MLGAYDLRISMRQGAAENSTVLLDDLVMRTMTRLTKSSAEKMDEEAGATEPGMMKTTTKKE